jgi:hypothetical protein
VLDQKPDHIQTLEGSRPALDNTATHAKIYLRRGLCSQKPKQSLLALLWAILASCGGTRLETVSVNGDGKRDQIASDSGQAASSWP